MRVWVHAASLGEAAGVIQILRHMPLARPCILTAQTQTGYDRLNRFAIEWNGDPHHRDAKVSVHLAPFDSPRVVRRFILKHGIASLILYESECWPDMLDAADKQAIPIFWLAARWGKGSQRLGSVLPNTVRRILNPIRHIQARSELDAKRIRGHFDGPVTVGCDVKGLGAQEAGDDAPRRGVALYCVHRSEWSHLRPHLRDWMKLAPLIVLPRYPEEFAFFRKELGPLGFICHSQSGLEPENRIESHVLVDALGCAQAYLRQCQVAFVGGTLNGKGGHAFWEPLRSGVSLVTGPSVHNQEPWVEPLQKAGILRILPQAKTREWARALQPLNQGEQAQQALRISVFLEELSASQARALEEMRAIFHAS